MLEIGPGGEAGESGQDIAAILREINRVQIENEAYYYKLLHRNRELSATVTIAQATSSSKFDLSETLRRGLQAVLEITGLTAGWVMLFPEHGDEDLVFEESIGIPKGIAEQQARFRSSECECIKILASRRPFVVQPLHKSCPISTLSLENGQYPGCHATVPLLSHSKVLGVLNLLGEKLDPLDHQELEVLGAIGQQLGIAIENARLWEELKRREALHSQMLALAIAAQEDERKHIARELHDQVGQALATLLVWLRSHESAGSSHEELTIKQFELQEFKDVVSASMDIVRDLVLDLRPSALDDLGLVPALERFIQRCHDRHGIAIDFEMIGFEGERIPQTIETALYRITQEALSNIVQHASASHVSIVLTQRTGMVVLVVEDNGFGFDANWLFQNELVENWLGLAGMRERAELLGGKLTIESLPGEGATVYAEIPLEHI
jgi:signal transduction histidine kinase